VSRVRQLVDHGCGCRVRPPTRRKQRGVSLIELMVAVTLGLIMVAGIGSVYLGTQQAYRTQTAQSIVQENGRFAIERLGRDIRQAGFFGCLKGLQPEDPRSNGILENGFIRNTLAPAPPASPAFDIDMGTPIVGYNGNGASWDPALPADTGLIVDADPNSDVIVMSRASGFGTVVTHHPGGNPPGSADIQVPPGSGIQPGHLLVVSDCRSASIFQVTAGNPNTSGSIPHSTGGSSQPGNWTRALGRNFVGAEVFAAERIAFYVAPGQVRGLSLYRAQTAVNAAEELEPIIQEVVENVERMQIRYGEDLNGDRAADEYRAANDVSVWDNVVSVRVSLLVSNGEMQNVVDDPQTLILDGEIFDAQDRRLYQVFTTTIGLRNRLD